ncbi:MAG TPA: 2-phosphosulfolactate phosphatase [Chthonomonadaceae bacterium]|nr:2-phosphosulfolactate phosphatase [Chthonomonadaceae bacterium]
MEIRVAFLPEQAGDVSGAVCVVVDVLRATTVIATLFARGCPRVYVTASHEAARAFARERGYVLCGETGGYKVPDFDYGNSPVEFAALDFTGRPVVLSTTNGTKAVAAVAGARRVLLGAAVNRRVVSQAAWQAARETSSDIVIVCAGTETQFTLEDATVAGLYVEAIAAQAGAWEMPEQADSAIAARRLWQAEPNLLRGWIEGHHAQTLADRGFGEDLGYCAAIDTLSIVPTLVSEADAMQVSAPVLLAQESGE